MSIQTFRVEDIESVIEPTTRPLGKEATQILHQFLRKRGEVMFINDAVRAILAKHPRHTAQYIRTRLPVLLKDHAQFRVCNVRGDRFIARIA